MKRNLSKKDKEWLRSLYIKRLNLAIKQINSGMFPDYNESDLIIADTTIDIRERLDVTSNWRNKAIEFIYKLNN